MTRKHRSDLSADYEITQDWEETRSAYHRQAGAFIHGRDVQARLCRYVCLLKLLMFLFNIVFFFFFKHGRRDQGSGPMSAIDTEAGHAP